MIHTMTTSQKTSSATFHKISIIDNGPGKGYPVFREGAEAPSLLGQPSDQIDQRLDQVQDCGDKDDGLQGVVLIAAFLFPGHFAHPLNLLIF